MARNSSKKSALILFSVLSSIVSITFLISVIARGYIPQFDNGLKITATGLLSANSIPKNASVIIDEKLYTTTDDTINLVPGSYQLQITKDGYLPWSKKINIEQELVYQAQASLFKKNPIIFPIVNSDLVNPTANPDLTQIVFLISSSSANLEPGIYLIETNYISSILSKYQPRFISPNPYDLNDNTITFSFSPNSKQLLLQSSLKKNEYLVEIATGTIRPVTDKTNIQWLELENQLNTLAISKIPKIFTSTISTNPASISFSHDETKFLYSIDDQYQVYDTEKNMNYILGNKDDLNSPFWLPKSNSIIYTNSGKIKSIEFDGTNDNTIYSGEFIAKVLIPQFDGEKIIISTASASGAPESIYSLTIR